jgi:hypothetical protein
MSRTNSVIVRATQLAVGCAIAGSAVLVAQPAYAATMVPTAPAYDEHGCLTGWACDGPHRSEAECNQAIARRRPSASEVSQGCHVHPGGWYFSYKPKPPNMHQPR